MYVKAMALTICLRSSYVGLLKKTLEALDLWNSVGVSSLWGAHVYSM